MNQEHHEAWLYAMRRHLCHAAELEARGEIGFADAAGRAAARCLERAIANDRQLALEAA